MLLLWLFQATERISLNRQMGRNTEKHIITDTIDINTSYTKPQENI